jgi:Protein of unknown function (DUF3992)
MILSDRISGNIKADCGEETVLWDSDLKSAFGTVTVSHRDGCRTMNVYINNKRVFSLKRGQTRTITVDDLRRLSIRCSDESSKCKGKFSIDLHYLQPASENNQRRRGENDDVVAPVSMNRICRY